VSGYERLDAPGGPGQQETGRQETGKPETSLGNLVGQLTGDLSRLMRAEISLAKAEAKEDAAQARSGVAMLIGAVMGSQLMLSFLSLAVMFALGRRMTLDLAALLVAVVWAVIAGTLAAAARKALRSVRPSMPETTETLKEDVRWAKKPLG
jgi:hypothetical protein